MWVKRAIGFQRKKGLFLEDILSFGEIQQRKLREARTCCIVGHCIKAILLKGHTQKQKACFVQTIQNHAQAFIFAARDHCLYDSINVDESLGPFICKFIIGMRINWKVSPSIGIDSEKETKKKRRRAAPYKKRRVARYQIILAFDFNRIKVQWPIRITPISSMKCEGLLLIKF